MDFVIRKIIPEDLTEKQKKEFVQYLYNVEKVSFSNPWSKQMFYDELKNTYAILYGAFNNDVLIAYIDFWIISDEAHIMSIAVVPEFRRKGIAKRLIENAISTAKKKSCNIMLLEARKSNAPAISLYKKLGFIQIGIRKRYYSDTGEDAVVMLKTLT